MKLELLKFCLRVVEMALLGLNITLELAKRKREG